MKIKLGISSCLLGEKVRYDGGHKLDRFLADTLGKYFEYVSICPEVECGLPVPREPMRLTGSPASPRLVTTSTGIDHTGRMMKWARKRLTELEREGLCGFIFKANSPSSGMERVRVYDEKGVPSRTGAGLFARAFMERFPLLPALDEERMHDPKSRENFIERIFTLKRWRELLAKKKSIRALAEFHARHRLLILSHSPGHYIRMGKLLAQAGDYPLNELHGHYQTMLMEAMRLKATPRKNAGALMRALRCFKKGLAPDDRRELLEGIDDYGKGRVPLIVPVTLMNHYVRKSGQTYLGGQYYLNPHPLELRLRYHV